MTVTLTKQALFNAGGEALLDRLLAEKSLRHFVRVLWPAIEPGRALVSGWVMDAICEHLEAVTAGEISRLIINCPPGVAKSLLTSVFWPAWEWGPKRLAHHRFLCAAYSQSLTIRDNGRFRALIGNDLFQRAWGSSFAISDKDDSKINIGNDRTGWKVATSVGGSVTGYRGDRVVLDDPNSVDEADSDRVRNSTNDWLRETLPTRLNDPKSSAIVVIQQRVHQEDATGTLLGDGDSWVHLCIPMEYDADRHCTTSIGWTDPRDTPGELCFPERFPAWVVARDKEKMGPYAVAGQLQQMPAPRGGEILSRDWWQTWGDPDDPIGSKFPAFSLTIGVLDGAYTTKEENDPSAMIVLGMFQDERTGHPQVMLARAWTARLPIHELVTKVDATARRYRVDVMLIENKANGISVQQELRRLFGNSDYGISMVDPMGRDKVARAHAVAPLMAAGLLWRPITDWSDAVVDQAAIFPRGSRDDLVDCLVHGLKWLRDQGVLERPIEARIREAMLSRPVPKSQRQPLYRT